MNAAPGKPQSSLPRRRRPARAVRVAALLPALAAAALIASDQPTLNSVRDLVFDRYLAASPRPYDPTLPVRVVDIDETSIARIGQWPWPRTKLAELIAALGKAGAAAIAVDFVLAEPDRTSPDRLLAQLPASPERDALERRISAEMPSNDDALAKVVAEYPVVLGAILSPQAEPKPAVKAAFAATGDDPEPFLPHLKGAILPLPSLTEAAKGIGSVNVIQDRDLVIRKVPTLLIAGGDKVPSLAIEALRVAQGASTILVKASNASGETGFGTATGLVALKVGDATVSTESDGAIRLRYAGTRPERRIAAWRVLEGSVPIEEIEGRIVLVGAGAEALGDIRATPLDPVVPGVDVHAETLEHILSGAELRRPDFARGLEIVLVLLAGLVAAIAVPRLRAAGVGWIAAATVAAMGIASWFAFSRLGLLIDPVVPGAAALFSFASATIVAYRGTERERARIRDAFGRYVSPAVVQELSANPDRLRLGGETRELTVMFSDIRGFTSRSEGLAAEDVVRFLNAVHTPMTEAVIAHRGTIDKYMGDGLMAFWNAPLDDPDHTRHALEAALAMLETLPAIEERLKQELGPGPALRVGIGINLGLVSVGNIGSSMRFDYSIVGDAVNAAARMEPLSKTYGVPIIVSEAIVAAAPDFAYLPVDSVVLRGRSQKTHIFALHGLPGVAQTEAFQAFREVHTAAVRAVADSAADAADRVAAAAAHPLSAGYAVLYGILRERLTQKAKEEVDD